MFSVLTGEWIRDLEGNTDGNIIGLHLDVDSNLLVACTNNGTFVFWKTESYVVSHKIVMFSKYCKSRQNILTEYYF